MGGSKVRMPSKADSKRLRSAIQEKRTDRGGTNSIFLQNRREKLRYFHKRKEPVMESGKHSFPEAGDSNNRERSSAERICRQKKKVKRISSPTSNPLIRQKKSGTHAGSRRKGAQVRKALERPWSEMERNRHPLQTLAPGRRRNPLLLVKGAQYREIQPIGAETPGKKVRFLGPIQAPTTQAKRGQNTRATGDGRVLTEDQRPAYLREKKKRAQDPCDSNALMPKKRLQLERYDSNGPPGKKKAGNIPTKTSRFKGNQKKTAKTRNRGSHRRTQLSASVPLQRGGEGFNIFEPENRKVETSLVRTVERAPAPSKNPALKWEGETCGFRSS